MENCVLPERRVLGNLGVVASDHKPAARQVDSRISTGKSAPVAEVKKNVSE
jgi:hypothetical protein